MVRMMVVLAAGTVLGGCAPQIAPPVEVAPPVAEIAPVPLAPAPKPALGTFGFDTAGMNPSVKPGDDFYEFADGTWAKNTPIPADKSNYSMFVGLQDLSQKRVNELLEAVKDDPNSKIGTAYSSFLNEAAVEAKGLAPIQPWLNEIRALNNRNGYAALSAKAARNGITGLFGGGVSQDDRHSDTYILGLTQAGLGMPDRDMYLLSEPNLVSLRAAYLDHLGKMLTLAGESNAAPRAKAILAFETAIAKVSWNREDSSDATKTYNRMTLAQLAKLAPGFDWATYLRAGGVDTKELLVAQPSAFTKIAALAHGAPLGVLKD
ncbi:MAG: M13 family metallopeptidase N-terminal domain-containing protein, partial [Sphingomicrobium sp.]